MSAFTHIHSALSLLPSHSQLDIGVNLHLLSIILPKDPNQLLIHLVTDYPSASLIFHWALGASPSARWSNPTIWGVNLPGNSTVVDESAVRTPFELAFGCLQLSLEMPRLETPVYLLFALNDGEKWLNNDGHNFSIKLI